MRTFVLAMGLLGLCPFWLSADVVYLKNGDRLTGKVQSLELKVLRISTEMAGDVNIPLDKIALFQTDGPVAIVAADGSVMRVRVVKYENGRFELATPATPAARVATAPATGPAPSAPAVAAASRPAGTTMTSEQVVRIGPAEPRWKGSISAGAIANRGNTNSEALNASLDLNRRGYYDRTSVRADYVYSREKVPGTDTYTTSADKWSNVDKYDYFFSPRWYAYIGSRFEHDTIANLYLRATPGAGLGYQWIETPQTKFNTEAGLNWVYERYTNPSDTHDYLAARLAWRLDHKFASGVQFIHNFEILPNVSEFSDYTLNTDAALRFRLTGHLFTEAKVVLSYDSTPAEGKKKLDEQLRLNIGYEF